jgi:succinate-semialdehyde dehydrogenase/glutarate-semialdehyde dehydrogenase
MTYQSLSPFDGKLIKDFDDINAAQYEAKLAAAQTCFETWRHKTYAERAVIIAKAAKLLHEQADAFAQVRRLHPERRLRGIPSG